MKHSIVWALLLLGAGVGLAYEARDAACEGSERAMWRRYMACVEGTCGPDITCVEQECQQILDEPLPMACEEEE